MFKKQFVPFHFQRNGSAGAGRMKKSFRSLISFCLTAALTAAAFFPVSASAFTGQAAATEGICEISPVMAPDFVLDARNCSIRTSPVSMVQLYRPLDVRQQEFFLEKVSPFTYRIINAYTETVLTAEGRSVVLKEAEGKRAEFPDKKR